MAVVMNLTAWDVRVYDRNDEHAVCKAMYLRENEPASVEFVLEQVAEPIMGQPVYRKQRMEITGLPNPVSGVYLIVMPNVAEAARLQGRDLRDLLVPYEVFDFEDKIDCLFLIQPQ